MLGRSTEAVTGFRLRHFFLTAAILVPVGITVIDEIGLPGNVNGVSMRVREQA